MSPFGRDGVAEGAPSRPRPVIRCGSRSRFRLVHSNAADHEPGFHRPQLRRAACPDGVGARARTPAGSGSGRRDDVAQEVWVAAVERPPAVSSDLRSWLAVVTRRVVQGMGRSSSRRQRREAHAARAEAAPDHSDVLARGETCQRLVAAVMALDEPTDPRCCIAISTG